MLTISNSFGDIISNCLEFYPELQVTSDISEQEEGIGPTDLTVVLVLRLPQINHAPDLRVSGDAHTKSLFPKRPHCCGPAHPPKASAFLRGVSSAIERQASSTPQKSRAGRMKMGTSYVVQIYPVREFQSRDRDSAQVIWVRSAINVIAFLSDVIHCNIAKKKQTVEQAANGNRVEDPDRASVAADHRSRDRSIFITERTGRPRLVSGSPCVE